MMRMMIDMLRAMPDQLERAFILVPPDAYTWTPGSWDGIPGETFSPIGQACHIRDIERDGYQMRIHLMLTEEHPDLPSIDSYALAVLRQYDKANMADVLREIRRARALTVKMFERVSDSDWSR